MAVRRRLRIGLTLAILAILACGPAQPQASSAEPTLAEAQAFALKHGVRFVLLIEPSSHDLTENIVPNYTHFARFTDYAPRTLTGTLETIAQELRMDYINLFEPFTNAGASGLYFSGFDNHWNDAGQALAATIVASRLQDMDLPAEQRP